MIYAIKANGDRIKATRNSEAFCSCCGEKLIPKCGEINIWHWSHSKKSNCESSGKMTEWHIKWQEKFEERHREVRVNTLNGYKIADIKLDSGMVIEFQNSPITSEEIRIREAIYDNMIWVLNYEGKYEKLMFNKNKEIEILGDNVKKSFYAAKKPIFLSLKDNYIYDLENKRILCVENSKTRCVSESEAQIKLFVKRYDYRKQSELNKNIRNYFYKNKKVYLIKSIIEQNKEAFIEIYDIVGKDYKMFVDMMENVLKLKETNINNYKQKCTNVNKEIKESNTEEDFINFKEKFNTIKDIW